MKECKTFLIGFGMVMAVAGVIMGLVVYAETAPHRADMAEIAAGRVSPTLVRIANITSQFKQRTVSGNHRVGELVKSVSFVTEDGRYFYKGWTNAVERRSTDTLKGYVVGNNLYVPDLYDEVFPFQWGFVGVGAIFLILCWGASRLFCRRVQSKQ